MSGEFNRLLELERTLVRPPVRAAQPLRVPGWRRLRPAAVSKALRWPPAEAFTHVAYDVPSPILKVVTSPNTCWAAATTILHAWRGPAAEVFDHRRSFGDRPAMARPLQS